MVKSIYVTGFGFPGKTIVIYGLMKILRDKGYKVGYFKPVSRGIKKLGPNLWVDNDIIVMKEALELKENLNVLSPLVIKKTFIELLRDKNRLIEKILGAYNKLSDGKDIVFIESFSSPSSLFSIGLSGVDISKLLESKVLFIVKNGGDERFDEVVYASADFKREGVDILGVIINQVPFHLDKRVKDILVEYLRNFGLSVFGVIPDKEEVLSPTLLDVSVTLDADVLEGKDYLNNFAGDFLVGAMGVDAALRWFRRAKKPLVITGGDRTELLLTLLELRPSGIILTGNIYPALKVLTKAREKKVPVLIVPYDTYKTVEKLREVHGKVSTYSLKQKEKMIKEMINEYVDVNDLIRSF